MPSRSSKPHRPKDLNLLARAIVEESIGEHLDGTPLKDLNAGKNPAAVALGKLGAPSAAGHGRSRCHHGSARLLQRRRQRLVGVDSRIERQ
jgi:hypothetical protein